MKNPSLAIFRVSKKIGTEVKEIRKPIEPMRRATPDTATCSDLMRQTQSLDACLDSIWRKCT